MLNRIYTLALSVVLLGVLRTVGTLMLDRHWALGLKRLALGAVEDAAVGPAVWMSSALAAVAALAAAALADRLVAPWLRTPERRNAAAAGALVGTFWAVLAAFEAMHRTSAARNVITARFDLTEAHLFILAAALVGACSVVRGAALAREHAGDARRHRDGADSGDVVPGRQRRGRRRAATGRRHRGLAPERDAHHDRHAARRSPRLYGYARKTSPRIDALATGGILYENAISQAPNTHPSTAAIIDLALPERLRRKSVQIHSVLDRRRSRRRSATPATERQRS